MNEKKAREIVARHGAGKCEDCFEGECKDEALGYLEAIDKAERILVKRFQKIVTDDFPVPHSSNSCKCHMNLAKEALAEWEKEK